VFKSISTFDIHRGKAVLIDVIYIEFQHPWLKRGTKARKNDLVLVYELEKRKQRK
jgi:hypothetical protein